MNNKLKYTSLTNYSLKLKAAIRVFDTILYAKAPKQLGSFKVSLKSLEDMLDNIISAQEMLTKVKQLPRLDEVASKDNKSARKSQDQIDSIQSELVANLSRLKDQYMKQLELCYKQYSDVANRIVDTEDRKRFRGDQTLQFRLMANEKEYEIPFSFKTQLEEFQNQRVKNSHHQEEQKISKSSVNESRDAEKLEEALNTLTAILISTPKGDLANDVRREVAQIKKVLSPKVLSISQEGLEQLQHSSQLLLDLQTVHDILKTTHSFLGSDGKLQKINKKLESVKQLVVDALEEEKSKNSTLQKEQDNIHSKIDYATEAVKTYGQILNDNDRLDRTQMQIRDHTHGYYSENERLEKAADQFMEEAQTILRKPLDKQSAEDGLRVDQLFDKTKEYNDTIKGNNTYMNDQMYKQRVAQLPLKYTDMKKRLSSMSSLYQLQFSEAQELASEGLAR